MASESTARPVAGDGPIAELFYAGRYHDVLTATVDSRRETAPHDLAFAVGALAFVGRVVEAELLFDVARRAHPSARTLAAGALFLAVALCRAGRYGDARAHLLRAARDTGGRRDAWSRAALLQGVACVRFFTGQLARAATAARAALACAQRGGSAYLQLLANDLRGHALAQVGRVNDGLTVLGHARAQAERLGYAGNAAVIDISIALHRSRIAVPDEAAEILNAAAARERAEDSYTRRTLRLELAILRAWQGRAAEATALVDEAARLCADEPRLQAWLATVRAQLARVREGSDAMSAHLDAAERLLDAERDVVRRIEIAGLRLARAHAAGDTTAQARHAEELHALAAQGDLDRARSWLGVYGLDRDPRPRPHDEMGARLRAIARGSVATAVHTGLLGLVPEAARLRPGRRVHLLDDATLHEDRGDVTHLPPLSERSTSVLLALSTGPMDRATLFETAWALRGYDPDRHDTLVKTAVSRLRASLGGAGAWIVASGGGYHLLPGVEVVRHGVARAPTVSELPPPMSRLDAARNERQRRILDALARVERATVGELSLRLREPVRTLSRELSAMCADDAVLREGAGRNTTYRLRSEKESP